MTIDERPANQWPRPALRRIVWNYPVLATLGRWLDLAVNVALAITLAALLSFTVGWCLGWVAVGFRSVCGC